MKPRTPFFLAVFFAICLGAPDRAQTGSGGFGEPLQLRVEPESIIAAAGEPVPVTVTLTNQGREMLEVFSHVATHETHLDPFQARLEPSSICLLPSSLGDKPVRRTIGFADERDKSAPVTKTLRTGDFIRHEVDLQAWARRAVNGGKPIEPGCYDLEMIYTVRDHKGVWNGSISSPRVKLQIRRPPG